MGKKKKKKKPHRTCVTRVMKLVCCEHIVDITPIICCENIVDVTPLAQIPKSSLPEPLALSSWSSIIFSYNLFFPFIQTLSHPFLLKNIENSFIHSRSDSLVSSSLSLPHKNSINIRMRSSLRTQLPPIFPPSNR